MANPITWYLQSRTIDDDQSILEAIDAKILTHNQDPSGHGQTGESVYGHREEPALDHPPGSVSLEHLVMEQILGFTLFESLDGWTKYGNTLAGIFSGKIYTDADPESTSAGVAAYSWTNGPGFDPAKNPLFQATVRMDENTNVTAYIVTGWYPIEAIPDSFGFKIINGTVYAYWTKSGAANTQALNGITTTDVNVYRAVADTDLGEISFYVNGVLKYRSNTNYPDTSSACFGSFLVVRTDDAVRTMRLIDWFYQQDR